MSKALVVYFSITGVTENVAQKLAEAIGADIFEVAPKEPVAESPKWKGLGMETAQKPFSGEKTSGNMT